jgi:hypothetical protein
VQRTDVDSRKVRAPRSERASDRRCAAATPRSATTAGSFVCLFVCVCACAQLFAVSASVDEMYRMLQQLQIRIPTSEQVLRVRARVRACVRVRVRVCVRACVFVCVCTRARAHANAQVQSSC